MTVDFSFSGYREMVSALIAGGYEIKDFAAVDPRQRHLVLRHDIDQCLHAAARLAALETEAGWRSSYFVLLRSEMYNPFSPAGLQALMDIVAGGHQIGLHLDASIYSDDMPALEATAGRECAILEAITGQKISMISFHRPAPFLMPCDNLFAGRGNTYESRFFNDIGYCSDSRGGWHHGPPWKHAALGEGTALQLLTHAIWWDTQAGESPQGRLHRLVGERNQVVRDELSANNAVYRQSEKSDPGTSSGE
jgi:hypothetical protein